MSRITRRIAVLCVVAAVCAYGVFYVHRSDAASLTEFAARYAAANDPDRELIAEEYLKRYPAEQLLAAVRRQFSFKICHAEAHPIGRAIYNTNKNLSDSIKRCGDACSYGCFHGVLMEMFKTDSDTLGGAIEESTTADYLAAVRSHAKELCTQPDVKDVVRPNMCYHGLGHVFANAARNDIETALASCDIWPEHALRETCASGVFMEVLLAPSSAALLNSKGEEPCNRFPRESYQCLRYKAYGLLNAWGDARSAMRACADFGTDETDCIQSVAEAQANRTRIESDTDIDALCEGLGTDQRGACVQGVLLIVANLNGADTSRHACDRYGVKYRPQCLGILQVSQMWFSK